MPEYSERFGPRGFRTTPWLTVILLCLVIVLLVRSFTNLGGGPLHDPNYQPRTVTPRGNLAEDEKSSIDLFNATSPSVTYITTTTVTRDRFSFNLTEIPRGTGSGFVYDKQGHIVTNVHVLLNSDATVVTLADQSRWQARLVGAEPDQDIAVLKISAPRDRLHPIAVGASDDLQVGQKVFAIGNPFGLDQTLTTGVISGLGREITSITERKIQGVIQTDAAINPGNSGGPLMDSSGRLIGVNTAIYSPSGAYAGVGFAVPVNTVNRIVPELIRHGKIARPVLGIVPDDRVLRRLGIDGVLVMGVLPRSGADEAGVRATQYDEAGALVLGDIVVAVNDEPTPNNERLLDVLEKYRVGETVAVTVIRDGEEHAMPVTLQAR